jgi:threonine/homoserine/homoserine lactone efflux protein
VVGVRRILTRDEPEGAALEVQETRLRRLYAQGVVVNVLNPKTALFFLAFLPQFVDRDRSVVPQVAILGLLFAAIALLSDLAYAVLADALAGRMRGSARAARVRRFATGGIFVALGITAAAAHRS